jgi:hypothetical protein
VAKTPVGAEVIVIIVERLLLGKKDPLLVELLSKEIISNLNYYDEYVLSMIINN